LNDTKSSAFIASNIAVGRFMLSGLSAMLGCAHNFISTFSVRWIFSVCV